MKFLISLIIAIGLVSIGRNFIKKHSTLCYVISTIIAILLIVGVHSGKIFDLPKNAFTIYILPTFRNGAFSTALFVIVMYIGALKNGSSLIKFLMPIRAELSIIASIFTLAHNISFGKLHFVRLFTNPSALKPNVIVAAIISLILIAIMLPLMITSFPSVRRKMDAKSWKKLQKTAYLFYGLIYAHVMLIMVPYALKGKTTYIFNIVIYTIVFLTYAVMRVSKAYAKKSDIKNNLLLQNNDGIV